MGKTKYHYNPHTLKYEQVKISPQGRILRVTGFLSCTFLLAVIIAYAIYSLIDSPKEKQLKREISQMSFHFELMQERLKQVDVVLKDMQQRDDHIYRAIFEAEPIHPDIRKAGYGGINRYDNLKNFSNSDVMTETAKMLDQISKEIYIQSKSYKELTKLARSKTEMMASIPAIQPIDRRRQKGFLSGFGIRIHPIYKIRRMHAGLDFTSPLGTPIYATGNGVIEEAGQESGYGNCVIINHSYSFKTLYGHMNRYIVKKGQRIKRGDLIGYVGNTGASTGPHLHYEVWKNGEPVNPVNFFYNDLTPQEYVAVLEASSQVNQSFD